MIFIPWIRQKINKFPIGRWGVVTATVWIYSFVIFYVLHSLNIQNHVYNLYLTPTFVYVLFCIILYNVEVRVRRYLNYFKPSGLILDILAILGEEFLYHFIPTYFHFSYLLTSFFFANQHFNLLLMFLLEDDDEYRMLRLRIFVAHMILRYIYLNIWLVNAVLCHVAYNQILILRFSSLFGSY